MNKNTNCLLVYYYCSVILAIYHLRNKYMTSNSCCNLFVMCFLSPTTKNVYSLGYPSQKSIHFGAFRSRLHPPPCLIHFEFLVTPPSLYIFNLLYEMRGGLTESCSTKKNRQISDPVPFIHFELPGRLSGGPTEYYQILHDSHDSTVQYLTRPRGSQHLQ